MKFKDLDESNKHKLVIKNPLRGDVYIFNAEKEKNWQFPQELMFYAFTVEGEGDEQVIDILTHGHAWPSDAAQEAFRILEERASNE